RSGQEAVEKAVASTVHRRRLEDERLLFVLGTLGNNAPFIGLFGTVLGIIRAFADLAAHPTAAAGASTVMAGISEALVATAVGLFVAIPAVLAYNIFQRLLKRVIGRSQSLGNAIAAGLHVAGANGSVKGWAASRSSTGLRPTTRASWQPCTRRKREARRSRRWSARTRTRRTAR